MKRVSRLVSVALLFGGCAHTRVLEPDKGGVSLEQMMPLAIGNRWTFETAFQGQAQADLVVAIVGRDGEYFVDDRPVAAHYRIDAEGLRDGAKRYLLKAPLREGTEWMSVADLMTVEHYRIAAVGERVAVPAGVFADCVRVGMQVQIDAARKMTNEMTFAPGVGIIEIRAAFVDGNRVLPQSHFKLKKFEPAARRSDP